MNIVTRFLISLLVNHCLIAQLDLNNQNNIDPLSETPLFSIPSEMTFEEYKDMNRDLILLLLGLQYQYQV